jgi:hypothetical protein
VVSIASGSLAPGEAPRLWVADEKRIMELTTDGSMKTVWEVPRFVRLLRLEAADLNDDGVTEWVVLYDTGRFRSHVLRWTGTAWESSKPWPGFLRPVLQADGTLRLLGQSTGGSRFHADRIVEVSSEADDLLVAGGQVKVVPGVFLYDFFWVPGESPRLFVLEESGSITERDPRSPAAVLWRSAERIVARPLQLRRRARDMLGEVEDDTVRLTPPVVVTQWDGASGPVVLLVTGPPAPMFAFENLRIPGGGDVRVFDVGQRGLEERVRSPLLGLDLSATWAGQLGGELLWLAAVWTKDSGGFVQPESRIIRLDPATGDPRSADRSAPLELPPASAPAVEEEHRQQSQD